MSDHTALAAVWISLVDLRGPDDAWGQLIGLVVIGWVVWHENRFTRSALPTSAS